MVGRAEGLVRQAQSCLARVQAMVQGILSEAEMITWDYDEDQEDGWTGRPSRCSLQCCAVQENTPLFQPRRSW